MLRLGEIQTLIVKRKSSVGIYLNTEDAEEFDVLLPNSQVPEGIEVGDEIEVFIYRDSKDRIICTTRKPKITLGQTARLQVIDVTKVGVFLDWGLERDLFLPFAETVGSVVKGKEYLVGLYIDKSSRLAATMKVKDMLRTDSEYKENDIVKGTIYSIHDEIGAFVAVDSKFDGLIPRKELLGVYEIGEELEVRVNRVLEDGKLDLTLRDRSYIQMDKDSQVIMDKLSENNGVLMLNDKSSPDEIRKELKMSKAGFKRAVGMLLRLGKIEFISGGIKLK
ncbi:MAG TPA: S1-like domain-containing RNA-binding protein [Tissierellaceae bacterium]